MFRSTRHILAGLAACTALTAPAWSETVLTGVMHSGLRVLDPVITTAHITRDHAYMIYDVLIAQDSNFQPQPQMAEWQVSDDGLTYVFTLRDGLKFHDGAPVTAADAVASLERWSQLDSGGQVIRDVTESLEATDERTITWTLTAPFGPMLDTLSKQSAVPPFIMPQRVAETPIDTAITEYVGSGPFVFVEDEFDPGLSVTYTKFEDYVPRDEPADGMAGGKVVHVDKVKWITMPDAMTTINALAEGEIDYSEFVQIDMLPIFEGNDDVVIEQRDPLGYQTMTRLNFLHPPFDDKRMRQAAVKALSQQPILDAMVGDDRYYELCGAVLGCGTPLGSETGGESLVAGDGVEAARALLAEAGYDGTPVVIMQPTDVVTLNTQPVVVAQLLRDAGFTVDLQPMDWQTLVTRRVSRNAPGEGGWSLFSTNWMVPEISTPLANMMLNGRGEQGWFGWPDDPEMEALKAEFIAATDDDGRKEVAERIQVHALDNALSIPMGQYNLPQGRRANITHMLGTPVPVFWEIRKE